MTPQMQNNLGGLPDHAAISASMAAPPSAASTRREVSDSPDTSHSALFGNLADCKRPRKYVVINDSENSNKGVRIKVALNEVNLEEVPDSYRERNSVYPRAWYPVQMQLSPGARAARRGRFVKGRDDAAAAEEREDDDKGEKLLVGDATVNVPMLEGRETALRVPGLGRMAREREEKFNDLGYRISWNALGTMDTRVVFLQRSCEFAFLFLLSLFFSFIPLGIGWWRDDGVLTRRFLPFF